MYFRKMLKTEENKNVWSRFKKNKTAMVAAIFIIVSFLISLFAYIIIPDNSPNANTQFSTLALQKPGFSTKILKVKKNKVKEKQSFINRLIHGDQKDYDEIAFQTYEISDTEISLVNHFNRPEFYSLPDQVFALDPIRKPILKDGNFTIFLANKTTKEISVRELQSQIERELIYTKRFYLGTDKFGRDILSRILLGIRISIFVGMIAVFISLVVGITLGAIGV